ncbi:esterase [Asanoa ishikariensis]|uniref:CubicO group peptidase, beta-lactamase class C family n=1 Tax=Asanoa ishikariensis TaxID=137265 RepID=A0A1H3MK86_9ACTN|nr:serine hydrolase domain-containing protein [Asanoa ishikariensis]GIF66186.1 esterase [Asanoa ishikariensis]SDY77091.1 CubicO group peptidase, beta-lactamase class C family [Asanoa ishikariensis]
MIKKDELREQVRATVGGLIADGRERGVQVCAYWNGEVLVDEAFGVGHDTPIFSFSTGKGLTATAVHVLAERGEIDYDLRIADVWAEYAAHGKGDTTLRHALTHSAGVPALPADIIRADLTDWDHMCALLADTTPLWTAGERYGYHAWTFGYLVGETVRRATGRTLSQVLADDIAAPLGVTGELFLAVPDADLPRLAVLEDRNLSAAMASASQFLVNFDRIAPPGVRPDVDLGNDPAVLRAEIPAVGTITARAAARMFAALIGEVDGVRLISPERLRTATTLAMTGDDWATGFPAPRGLGYQLDDEFFGASGNGGSIAYAFPDLGLTVAATKNLLSAGKDDPMEDLRRLIRQTFP